MIERDEYIAKLKARLDEWNAEAAKWEAKSKAAQVEMRAQYEEQLAAFRRQRDAAFEQMRKVPGASGEAWTELARGADEAWSRMEQTFEKARSHFGKWRPVRPVRIPLLPVAGLALACAMLATDSNAASARAAAIQSEEHSFRVVRLAEGLEHPWGLAFLPDGRMLVTERPGRLLILGKDGEGARQPVAGLPPIADYGQGGLLDVALHPRYRENGLVYLAYAAQGAGGVGTEVARGRLAGARLENVEVIFRQQPKGSTGRHFGSRLVFDRQGLLYITLGDRGEMERAQRPDDHAGSVIRVHDDGRVPKDNPFVGNPGWKPEKYTLGNRNIQGAALHPVTGMLWTHEHGPQGGDEVNVIRPGVNYGWPIITYGVNYITGTRIGEGTHKSGMAQPLHYWTPSIAPSGMAFYAGDRFPRWRGDLFIGALRDQMLVRLKLDGEKVVAEERMLKNALGRIRDVRVGPDGNLYLLTDRRDGVLARLEPADR